MAPLYTDAHRKSFEEFWPEGMDTCAEGVIMEHTGTAN